MKYQPRIMNITNGDEVNLHFDNLEEAEDWIAEQDCPEAYMIMEEFDK